MFCLLTVVTCERDFCCRSLDCAGERVLSQLIFFLSNACVSERAERVVFVHSFICVGTHETRKENDYERVYPAWSERVFLECCCGASTVQHTRSRARVCWRPENTSCSRRSPTARTRQGTVPSTRGPALKSNFQSRWHRRWRRCGSRRVDGCVSSGRA